MFALLLDKRDNVAVAVEPIGAGTLVEVGTKKIIAAEAIKKGHKIAVSPIAEGGLIYKYGEVIGQSSAAISAGEWVHTHNVRDISVQLGKENEGLLHK